MHELSSKLLLFPFEDEDVATFFEAYSPLLLLLFDPFVVAFFLPVPVSRLLVLTASNLFFADSLSSLWSSRSKGDFGKATKKLMRIIEINYFFEGAHDSRLSF